MSPLLVLRPEPGASQTIAAARARGLDAIAAPLFAIEPVAWAPPADPGAALMLTSANAVRYGGSGLAALAHLPVYAVGAVTAEAARAAGFAVAHVGRGDAQALIGAIRAAGIATVLHLTGAAYRDVADPALTIRRVIVYRARPIDRLPAIVPPRGAVAMLHSPAAAALFAGLIDAAGLDRARFALAAISAATAEAAGEGWGTIAVAPRPSDTALLAIAAKLCEEARKAGTDSDHG